jgi:hypothetical protein
MELGGTREEKRAEQDEVEVERAHGWRVSAVLLGKLRKVTEEAPENDLKKV